MNKATREAYGEALVELSKINKDVVVLDADLSKSTKTAEFQKVSPERFFNIGIAEADMIGTAAGLATCGKIPFASTFAIFATGRAYEQIRNSVAYPKLNVKIAATHAGITVGEDGATHQSIEDISLMRSIPNMVVINPSDDIETKSAILAAAEYKGPVYIRLGRMAVPTIHDDSYKFQLGKGEVIKNGKDVTIIATGITVSMAIEAAEELKKDGIDAEVINIHTIKPIDKELIIKTAQKTGRIVTVEEHSIIGGLGSAVCEVLSQEYPTKVKMIGINDVFGQSGKPKELLEHYGISTANIIKTAKSLI
ncbi:transketolase family protein [Thermoanaerobacterium thermosaccharolyticum]|uniref:Transketolase central region n=1 Tax=Thermoanaerobacterium thermosaccharolyticum (strain ATCC 7956 / DSM 571 / NCIMB 9385 / NCA 3814 / NCTC 13789 / WDCM 00135 / 2032) TaxID=580327 RepID=D9TSZ7_THETC|nr:transketolase family protein [Thermoanaerobacterium thermosaccharolyticum]ADL69395.1 Transketolase central region [Thermoanaerobacterium thermosaccharolyticum DSM 571]